MSSSIQSNMIFRWVDSNNKTNFDYFYFDNLHFTTLLEKTEYDKPYYIPYAILFFQTKTYKSDFSKIFFDTKFSSGNLYRNHGDRYNRIGINPAINTFFNTLIGDFTIKTSLNSDIYAIKDKKTNTNEKNLKLITPEIDAEWRKTLFFDNISIQPIVKYSGSSKIGELNEKIKNEDSDLKILSFENIFLSNRFIGNDRREIGNRINYGIDISIFDINLGIAQGYRNKIKESEIKLYGFDKEFSDYVGYFSYNINNNLNFYYRFLIDEDKGEFLRNEFNLNFLYNDFNLYFIYVNNSNKFAKEINSSQEQINITMLFNIFDKWQLNLSNIIDLKNSRDIINSRYGLIYNGNCTKWEINYVSHNNVTDGKDNYSVNFNFIIKSF
jgi:hypothetical protein